MIQTSHWIVQSSAWRFRHAATRHVSLGMLMCAYRYRYGIHTSPPLIREQSNQMAISTKNLSSMSVVLTHNAGQLWNEADASCQSRRQQQAYENACLFCRADSASVNMCPGRKAHVLFRRRYWIQRDQNIVIIHKSKRRNVCNDAMTAHGVAISSDLLRSPETQLPCPCPFLDRYYLCLFTTQRRDVG